MTKFTVYYAKKMPFGHEAPTTVNMADYDKIGEVEAEDLEALFEELNIGTTPRKLRVRSMSVGDLAVDGDTGMVTYCCSMGWNPVGWAGVNVENPSGS